MTCSEGPGPGCSSTTSHRGTLGKRPDSSEPLCQRGPSPRHAAVNLFPGWSAPSPQPTPPLPRRPQACFRFPIHLLGSAGKKGSVSGLPPSLLTTLCPPGPTLGEQLLSSSAPLPPLPFISALFSQPSPPWLHLVLSLSLGTQREMNQGPTRLELTAWWEICAQSGPLLHSKNVWSVHHGPEIEKTVVSTQSRSWGLPDLRSESQEIMIHVLCAPLVPW